jgi:hypothetical protein
MPDDINLSLTNMIDERTTSYLLEELTERDAEQFEEQLFKELEWPAADLDSAEEDLIDAYIRNELTPDRQRRFEEKYLTTDARRERVLLARSFLRVVCSSEPAKQTWTERFAGFWKAPPARFATPRFAMIALLVIGVTLALVWFARRPRAPQSFANLSLSIAAENRSQSAPASKVTLPLGKDALRISLAIPAPAPTGAAYRVQWEDVNGPLETLKIEAQDERSVSVVIPAERLSRGQYALKLYRKDPDGSPEQRVTGSYFFTVD